MTRSLALMLAALLLGACGDDDDTCGDDDVIDGPRYICNDVSDCDCYDACWSFLAEDLGCADLNWENVEWYCDLSLGPVEECGETWAGRCRDRFIDPDGDTGCDGDTDTDADTDTDSDTDTDADTDSDTDTDTEIPILGPEFDAAGATMLGCGCGGLGLIVGGFALDERFHMQLSLEDVMKNACLDGGILSETYVLPSDEARLAFRAGENLLCGHCDDAPYCPDPPIETNRYEPESGALSLGLSMDLSALGPIEECEYFFSDADVTLEFIDVVLESDITNDQVVIPNSTLFHEELDIPCPG